VKKLIPASFIVGLTLVTAIIIYFVMKPGKLEEKSRFIVFAGGARDSVFANKIAKGARHAEEHLGVELQLYWSNWDFKKMVLQFKQAIDSRPDGIAIMGHPGVEALSQLVDEARRKGIIVTSMNVPLAAIESKYFDQGFGYVGQDLHKSGEDLAKVAIKRFNLNKQDKVIFFGTEAIPIRGQRSTAARKVFENNGLEVIYTEKVLFETNQQGHDWHAALVGKLLKQHPEAKLIFDDIDVASAARGLKEAGVGPDAIPLVGFDVSIALIKDLKQGYIDLLSDQQPFLQGYLSVLQLELSHRWRFSGLNINTGSGIVTSNTVSEIEAFIDKGIR